MLASWDSGSIIPAMSRLRRLVLSDRFFFISCRVLPDTIPADLRTRIEGNVTMGGCRREETLRSANGAHLIATRLNLRGTRSIRCAEDWPAVRRMGGGQAPITMPSISSPSPGAQSRSILSMCRNRIADEKDPRHQNRVVATRYVIRSGASF